MERRNTGGTLRRRDFLAMATAGAASMMTLWPARQAMGQTTPSMGGEAATPGGISSEAFEAARKRAAEMVAKMTLDEKLPLFGPDAPAVPRLGVAAFKWYGGEALHGLARSGPITSFPLPLAMGCSWNRDLVERVFSAVSDEIWAWHKKDGQSLAMFSPPTVNMGTRDPRWGRIGENYSEDPYLVSQMAIYTIHGMQGHDARYLKTIACAKHYAANDTDDDREQTSAAVDARSFWEYYSRGFEACVREGRVFTVMSSYNELNGIPTSASKFLLTDLLRKQWGFRGYVVSDCNAIGDIFSTHHFVPNYAEASALAINAGSSINCGHTLREHLGEALDQMLVSEAEVDEALARAFTGRVLLGEFDPPEQNPYSQIPVDCLECKEHRALAREAARQSIVLLKNDNNTLPLDKRRTKKIAVIGPMADSCRLGDYSGMADHRISPLRGISNYLGIPQAPGYFMRTSEALHVEGRLEWRDCSEGGECLGYIYNGATVELPQMVFDGATELRARVSSQTAGGTIEVYVDSLSGPRIATLQVNNTGGWNDWVDVSAPISLLAGEHSVFLKFAGGEERICNVESISLAPAKPLDGQGSVATKLAYAMGCTEAMEKDPAQFDEAVKIAREADVVLLFVGADAEVSKEGHDRTDIALPGAQHELVGTVYAANPRTILVICSRCPVAVSWEQENLPAIVGGHFAGQEQGAALAEVLFGDYNPGGKLSTTWFHSVWDLPDFHDYNVRNGRTYMYYHGRPLYPFGHGLSYTTFRYKNIQLSDKALKPGGKLTVTFELTNAGNREGDEVAQLYVHFPESKVERPRKQLVQFDRVHLKAGETRTVSLELPYEQNALRYWNESKYAFVVEPGSFEVMVGASSADIRLREEVQLSA